MISFAVKKKDNYKVFSRTTLSILPRIPTGPGINLGVPFGVLVQVFHEFFLVHIVLVKRFCPWVFEIAPRGFQRSLKGGFRVVLGGFMGEGLN